MAENVAVSDDAVGSKEAGYALSYSITVILNAIIVVFKEGSESVHNFMAALTGHHWVTHGLIDIIVFVVLGMVLSRRDLNMSGSSLVKSVVGSTVIGGLIIAIYMAAA